MYATPSAWHWSIIFLKIWKLIGLKFNFQNLEILHKNLEHWDYLTVDVFDDVTGVSVAEGCTVDVRDDMSDVRGEAA